MYKRLGTAVTLIIPLISRAMPCVQARYKALRGGWRDASDNAEAAPAVGTLGNAGMRNGFAGSANVTGLRQE